MPPPTLTVVDGADRTPNLLAPVVPDRIVVCQSPAMVRLYEQIERIARTPVTVVIEGETGVGKELVARTLHGQSPRREKPFVPVNCGAIPETIQESLLFGHERGAFTDANQRKEGYFRQADGGTILLDEVVELNARAQTSLLRVMQDYKVRSIGGREEVQVDVRVIAATNKSLEQAVKDGSFREDLYYRLNVITLTVPPLRERLEDIPLLARYFVDHYATKYGTGAKELSGGAMIQLLAYDWPGNIRQLENVIQAAVALDDDGTIGKDDIDLPTHRQGSVLRRALQEQERAVLSKAYSEHGGSVRSMAKGLGIPYRTAYRRLQKYGIQYGRQNKGGRPPNVLHPGYEGGRLFLSQAIKELVGMSSFDRIPASRLKALRLDHVVDGAFSLEEKGEPHYFAASIIAQVVKQDPATQHLFAPYVSISGLIDMYTPHSLLPPDAMKDRVAYLQRQGVTSVKNNMLPLAQVDLVLTDLFQLECGTPVSYGNNIIDLPPVEEGVVREGTLPEGGAVEKVRLPQF